MNDTFQRVADASSSPSSTLNVSGSQPGAEIEAPVIASTFDTPSKRPNESDASDLAPLGKRTRAKKGKVVATN